MEVIGMVRVLSVSFVFLVVNVALVLVILALSRRAEDSPVRSTPSIRPPVETHLLDASTILGKEFDYARTTASEALDDRHRMIDFYLVFTGIVVTGVLSVLNRDGGVPDIVGTVLLWFLCGIGWLYFLKLIRLRQAWHDSARAMNRIKDFYIQHAKEFAPDVLERAFRWRSETLPAPEKPWTLHFFSAMLIGLIDTVAYVLGGALLDLDVTLSHPLLVLTPLVAFGLSLLAFYIWAYVAFLRPTAAAEAATGGPEGS
jgi:hypothetical protein